MTQGYFMKKLFLQIFKFVLVGGLSFILDFILYYIFTRFFLISEMTSQVISFSISLIFNYLMSMKYVFVSKDSLKKHHEFMIFVTLSVLGAGLNWLLFYLMVYVLSIHDLITKIVVAGIVMVFNFVTRKLFIEKK
jgi:putative flippase GtrA